MTTARDWAARLRRREVSPVEVIEHHLRVIAEKNPRVNAIVTLTAEKALEKARKVTPGPLFGLPVAHKDLQETRGVRTTFGSPIFRDYVPNFDTEIVRRMNAAGAISLGKTNTPEFGAGSQTFNPVFGKTRNPFDLSKTCGGSSGGAAVALATGMIALADGSDMGGSLRNPASFCGVTGMRPTIGVVPGSTTLVTDGPMARNAGDLAMLLDVVADLPAHGELDRDFRGARVAWCGEIEGMPFDAEVRAVVDGARRRFEALGCVVEEAAPAFAGADEAFRVLRAHEFHVKHGEKLEPYRNLMKETVVQELERGALLKPSDVERAMALREALIEKTKTFHASYEYFVLPTVQVLPFDIDQPFVTEINGATMPSYIDWMKSCYFVSMLGAPAVSTPAGFSRSGLPVGMQIVGPRFADWSVLQLAHAVEEAAR
ncbi:MAG: amidase [Acidobacteria bacterium]|nr:amidase [Acidobacteriota bacterium]